MGKKTKNKAKKQRLAENTKIENIAFRLKNQPQTLQQLQQCAREIHQLLDDLITFQRQHRPQNHWEIRGDPLQILRQWIEENAPVSGLGEVCQIVDGLPQGRGMIALKRLEKEQLFLRIPRSVMISIETAIDVEHLGHLLARDPVCNGTKSIMLSLFLIYEARKGESSFYFPYINALPTDVTLPLMQSLEQLAALEGTFAYRDCLKLKRSIARDYVYLYTMLQKGGLEPPTFREYMWATSIVMTRQNQIPSLKDPATPILTLIPGWDMCNYQSGEVLTYYDTETDLSESYTLDVVEPNEQIFIFYGHRPYSHLLLHSGFVHESNKVMEIRLSLRAQSKEADSLFPMRRLCLSKLGMSTEDEEFPDVVASEENFGSSKLMPFLRIAAMNKEEAIQAMKTPDAFLGERCEKAALELLCEEMQEYLDCLRSGEEKLDERLNALSSFREKEKGEVSLLIDASRERLESLM